MNWSLAKEIVVLVSAAIGILIAIYKLILKPRVKYSIEKPDGEYQITTHTGGDTHKNEECEVRVIRIKNCSRMHLNAKSLFVHIRTSSKIAAIRQMGIYMIQYRPNDDVNPTMDYTFFLDSLPHGGKLKFEIKCFKKDRNDNPFFLDHEVLTADGRVKKVNKLKGFDDPSPVP